MAVKKKPAVQWTYATPQSNMPLYGAPGGALRGGSNPVPSAPRPMSNPYAGIMSDYLNQMRADNAASSAADKGGMINALRRYAISYGALPDFTQLGGLGADAQGYLQEALDPATQALMQKAEAEGVSSHARLSHANDIAMRQIPAGLAGRGLLNSGQTGTDLGEQALGYKTQGYDMLNSLLSGMTGSVQGYQEGERQRQRALAEAEMQQAMQAAQDWGDSYFDGGGGGGSVARPAGSVAGARPAPYFFNPFAPTRTKAQAAVHVGAPGFGGRI